MTMAIDEKQLQREVEQMKRQLTDPLELRITELQTRNTELENERRMWKARCEAKTLLLEALIEGAEASYMDRTKEGEKVFDMLDTSIMKRIHQVMVRNDLLAADAWTMTTQLAKKFLERASVLYSSMPYNDEWKADAAIFISDFIDQFNELFKEK